MAEFVDELIDSIAHAAVDPTTWIQVIDHIACLFPGIKIVMHSEDNLSTHNVGLIYRGISDQAMLDYPIHFAHINPWMHVHARIPTMHAHTSDEILPADLFKNSEFYNDFLRSEGEMNHAAGMKIFHERHRLTMISAHYGDRRADQYNTKLKRTLQTLAPHFRTALEVNRRISSGNGLLKSLDDVIHFVQSPLCLLDKSGKMLLANQAFLAELSADGVFRASGADKIMPRNQRFRQAFDNLIRSATSQRASVATATTGTFEMTVSVEGRPPVQVTALSFRPCARAGLPWLSSFQIYALVALGRRSSGSAPTASDLEIQFGLTPTESRLAVHMCAGLSLAQCADRCGVRYETARTYLRSIFAKTETHRQAELVARLLSGRMG